MNIFVYEKDPDIQNKLKELFSEQKIKKFLKTPEELIELINSSAIEVLLIKLSEISEQLKELIKIKIPYLIVITEENMSSEIFKKSLECGAKDYFSGLPASEKEIAKVLSKANSYLNQLKQNTAKDKKNAKVITFLSSKGGVGKSICCTNLASLMQKEYQKKILMIDMVPRFGSLDILIDVKEKKSMGLIPVNLESYSSYWQEIEDNIITHSSGLHLLTTGEKNSETVSLAKLKTILAAVKDKYDFIFIDTDCGFSELNLGLLELSDQVLFISTFDIPAIKNLSLGLETIKSFYFSTDKIKIIINRFDKNNEITVEELEKFLKYKVTGVIPEERATVLNAINRGIPFIFDLNGESALIKSLKNISECLLGKECKVEIPTGPDLNHKNNGWLGNFLEIFKEK